MRMLLRPLPIPRRWTSVARITAASSSASAPSAVLAAATRSCVSVESGNDSQVNTRGFGNIGMQFQNSPVGTPISNVHVSNFLANNNSNNTIIGNQDLIINGNAGASAGLFGGAVAATPDAARGTRG